MVKLTDADIESHLQRMPGWNIEDASITRTFEFKDFVQAMAFVNQVADLAEKAWHHPDIDIRWNTVTLTLSTHSEGGLTEKDFTLAQRVEGILG